MGDEGSGAVLGKHFLSDVLKGLAPKEVMADFFEKFRISPNEVMESVYNRPFPNRFLSTISYFLADYTSDDYVYELIITNCATSSQGMYANMIIRTIQSAL